MTEAEGEKNNRENEEGSRQNERVMEDGDFHNRYDKQDRYEEYPDFVDERCSRGKEEPLSTGRREWRESQDVPREMYGDRRRGFEDEGYYRGSRRAFVERPYYHKPHRFYDDIGDLRRRRPSDGEIGAERDSSYGRPGIVNRYERHYRSFRPSADEFGRAEGYYRPRPYKTSHYYPYPDHKYREGRRDRYELHDREVFSKSGRGYGEEVHPRALYSKQEAYNPNRNIEESRQDYYYKHDGSAEKPWKNVPTNVPPSKSIGLFGLSVYATEDDVRDFLKEKISDIQGYKVIIVYDRHRRMSKGYGFVYFETLDDAITAKDRLTGQMIKGKEIRVDYSTTGSSRSFGNYIHPE